MADRGSSRVGRFSAPARSAGRALGRTPRYVWRKVSAFTAAGGAGETGLARLVHLEFLDSAGDAVVAVALAGTIFFGLPTDQARPQVARFLVTTMAPLAVLAPFIGPFLDHVRHGRRWAIGITTALRAFLCWVLAGQIDTDSVWLFVCALGVLVANKAYAISRAAAVPRLLPDRFTLVNANSRIAVANVAGLTVGGAVAAGVARIGPGWALRGAFAIFIAATVLAIRLPARADAVASERDAGPLFWRRRDPSSRLRHFRAMTPALQRCLLATLGSRLMSGFLTFFVAFLFRSHPVGGLHTVVALAIVVAGSGLGSAAGTVAGNLAKDRRPEILAVTVLAMDAAAAVLTTLLYSVVTVTVTAFIAGLASRVARLGYDARVQSDVDESVRTSVFGRSEAVFQMCWVIGGFLGIGLPLLPRVGFAVIGGLLLLVVTLAGVQWWRMRDSLSQVPMATRPDGP